MSKSINVRHNTALQVMLAALVAVIALSVFSAAYVTFGTPSISMVTVASGITTATTTFSVPGLPPPPVTTTVTQYFNFYTAVTTERVTSTSIATIAVNYTGSTVTLTQTSIMTYNSTTVLTTKTTLTTIRSVSTTTVTSVSTTTFATTFTTTSTCYFSC